MGHSADAPRSVQLVKSSQVRGRIIAHLRKWGMKMTKNERQGVRPSAWCTHGYPIEVRRYQGGYRARCLKCGAYGPVYEDATSARQALLGKLTDPNT